MPGTYSLSASLPDESAAARQLAASASFADQLTAEFAIPRGNVSVSVAGSVDSLVVTISPPGVLVGRLTVNGEPPSSVPNLDRVRLALWPSESGGAFPLGPSTQVSSNGAFRFDRVPAAAYQFRTTGLPEGFYVEKAEMNGVDMLSETVTFSSSSSGNLNVVLQRGTGAIRGTVTDAQARQAIGVEVVLVPEQRRRLDLYKTAITDKTGRFTIAEIPPGNYRLFSWEAIDAYRYYDPEILSRDESLGLSVRITPASNDSVDVRIIPVNEFEGR
jgi:Carboxypeptidase regulatory-like domain